MPDNQSMDDITDARRRSIEETIKTISVEELNGLGEGIFPSHDHPWREKFFRFISENAGASFYHAVTHDRVHIIYCQAKDEGMWFQPGSGMGPLQEKGRKILKAIVEKM